MSEPEQPRITIDTGTSQAEIGPDEAELYTFWGDLSMYNHVFLVLPGTFDGGTILEERSSVEGGEKSIITYVFAGEPLYDPLVKFMQAHDFPQHLNMRTVPEDDKNAYFSKQLYVLNHSPDA